MDMLMGNRSQDKSDKKKQTNKNTTLLDGVLHVNIAKSPGIIISFSWLSCCFVFQEVALS